MTYVKKSITVRYEDNTRGKKDIKTKVFSGKDQLEILKDI